MARQEGQSALEYAILLGLVVLLAMGALSILAGDMGGILDSRRNNTTSGTDQLYTLVELNSTAEARMLTPTMTVSQPVIRPVMMLGIDPSTGQMTMSEGADGWQAGILSDRDSARQNAYFRATGVDRLDRLTIDSPHKTGGLSRIANREVKLATTF